MRTRIAGRANAPVRSPREAGAVRSARFVSLGLALALGACRTTQAFSPRDAGQPTPAPATSASPRVVTPSVPRYEGCYVTFDAATDPVQASTPGTLTLALAADPAGMGGFVALEVTVLDCAGANRGVVRDVGWARVPAAARTATLDVATGAAVTVAEGPLPSGGWDRVFAAVPEAWGVTADGRRTALEVHVEPIARGFSMPPGGRVMATMQLTTRARPAAWNGGWNLFTKDAWLAGDDGAAP